MEFRPCIDIHNGKVKQIVGGTLRDEGDRAAENFVSEQDSVFYAELYRRYGLQGGHIILLNPAASEYYAATKAQALAALRAWPGGMQVGGGITPDTAAEFLEAGASHVIVTSYVFRDGQINYENLEKLTEVCGREKLVLDLSCRKRDGRYYVVTDRWQRFTDLEVTVDSMLALADRCDEFLIHAADVEGKANGVERELIGILTETAELLKERDPEGRSFPITYAGGVGCFEDLLWLKEAGRGMIHVTIGSALDLFGGSMGFEEVLRVIG